MGLKIAAKIREQHRLQGFPTRSDIVPTSTTHENTSVPTIRHFRHHLPAVNDSSENSLVTSEGLPVYFYDGGENGWRFGDGDWIAAKLRRVCTKERRLELAAEYAERFKAVYDAEPLEHRKDGKARFSANSWLLKATK